MSGTQIAPRLEFTGYEYGVRHPDGGVYPCNSKDHATDLADASQFGQVVVRAVYVTGWGDA